MRKWLMVGKMRNVLGRHTGYCRDPMTSHGLLADGVGFTALFLDLWGSPSLEYAVLVEEELEGVLGRSWIRKRICNRAKKEMDDLVGCGHERVSSKRG